jgi:phosphatidylglycerophosphate synthase
MQMDRTRVFIDARGHLGGTTPVSAASTAGGLPLVVRTLRLLARAGWPETAVLVASAEEEQRMEALLVRHGRPAGTAVVRDAGDPIPGSGPVLQACALYSLDALRRALRETAPPEPLLVVTTRADLRRVEQALFRQVKKSVEMDGVLSFYLMRSLTYPVTRVLLRTPVTPNQVTLAALALGLVAAALCGLGTERAYVAAGLLYFTGLVLDHVDGDLARIKLHCSRLGEWLDSITDDLTTFALFAGLGVGLSRSSGNQAWQLLGVVGAALGCLAHAKIYLDLHRLGRPIDSAQYPWFFGTTSETGVQATGPLGAVVSLVAHLVRRDAFSTLVSLLLVLAWPVATIAVLAMRGVMVVPVLAVHLLVTALRRHHA